MPEIAELKIMSDYINQNCIGRVFNKSFHVLKGNNAEQFTIFPQFSIIAESFGKELKIKLCSEENTQSISVFMGMSGNWLFTPTVNWSDRKFTRLRFDTIDGHSLLLYGLYMGPKYKIGGFAGVKRGPDPTKEFEHFKNNILENLNKPLFNLPICDALLNQEYFNGIGNYLRSTIIYYLDCDPFEEARTIIKSTPEILDMCKDIPMKAYFLNGGQLSDWINPFDTDYREFQKWVYYQKGISCKDKSGRTFWFNPKWQHNCPYVIKNKVMEYEK
jgi:endonuclease VIII-like 1